LGKAKAGGKEGRIRASADFSTNYPQRGAEGRINYGGFSEPSKLRKKGEDDREQRKREGGRSRR